MVAFSIFIPSYMHLVLYRCSHRFFKESIYIYTYIYICIYIYIYILCGNSWFRVQVLAKLGVSNEAAAECSGLREPGHSVSSHIALAHQRAHGIHENMRACLLAPDVLLLAVGRTTGGERPMLRAVDATYRFRWKKEWKREWTPRLERSSSKSWQGIEG